MLAFQIAPAPVADFRRAHDLEDHNGMLAAADGHVRNPRRVPLLASRRGGAADLRAAGAGLSGQKPREAAGQTSYDRRMFRAWGGMADHLPIDQLIAPQRPEIRLIRQDELFSGPLPLS